MKNYIYEILFHLFILYMVNPSQSIYITIIVKFRQMFIFFLHKFDDSDNKRASLIV